MVKGNHHKDKSVDGLRDYGGEVVPKPEKAAFGFGFPKMKSPDIVELGQGKGCYASNDNPQAAAKNGFVLLVKRISFVGQ